MLNRPEMLNRRAASPKFKSCEVMELLNVRKGSTICDIGSGGGYFAYKFAGETGLSGKVYAIDINRDNLSYIEEEASKRGLDNIETRQIIDEQIKIPESSCDLIFLRNVYHHIEEPSRYFMKLKPYLKETGRLVVIEYKKNQKLSFTNFMRHHTKEEDILHVMANCGYKHTESYHIIKGQSFNVFEL